MVDKEILVNEIKEAHKVFYSLKQDEQNTFDINIDSVNQMSDKQLIQLLKLLNSLVKDNMRAIN